MQGNGLLEFGAHARIRTGDLFLTKNMLCSLARKSPVLISATPFPNAIGVLDTAS